VVKNLKVIWIGFFVWISAVQQPLIAQVREAETGEKTGTVNSTQRSGFSGTGYVTGFDNDGDQVSVKLTVNRGIYNVYLRYASPSGDKFNFLLVNGQNNGSVAFPMTTVFTETKAGKVYLERGENTLTILKDWGYVDIDNFRVEQAEPSPIHNVADNLVTPSPSSRADSLYNLLKSLYGKVIISGQYGGSTELNTIENISGKTPAMRGFDLIDYSPSRVERGASSAESENAMAWNDQRGIVTFCWHWNAPKDLVDEPGKEWWRGFYTDATTFDLSIAMNDASSQEYSLLIRDIDAIAVQLQKLEDAGIPVLWRPLHEAEGTWFWWGAKGPDACKWLWKLLFDRLVNYHHLNNLIWVWTSTSNPSALEWYPGDEFVDMIGADIYLPDGNYGSSFTTFDNMAALYGGRKIIAMSENGPIPDPERLFLEGAGWSWFCTWSGEFITDGVKNSTDHINQVYNHDYTITLDEINDLQSIITVLDQRRQELDNEADITSVEAGQAHLIQYQNPIKGHTALTIRSDSEIAGLQIFDNQGRLIFQNRGSYSSNQVIEIDFADYARGFYIMKVLTPSGPQTLRLIKM
jgi:mannan endo-1,4-beta-mannosidase